jgi:hypothetical protein
VFEELGRGFRLLAFGVDDDAVHPISLAADCLRVPLKIVRDTAADERSHYESRLTLVRPDQYVVWCANAPPSDAATLVRKVIGIG